MSQRQYLLEQVDDAAVVQLYDDGFSQLSLADKRLVWHLAQAALAGRDIYYDQRHQHNLAMRDIVEEILTHSSKVPAPTIEALTHYAKLFWINTGPYNNLTARKFVLGCTRAELLQAATLARQTGAVFPTHGEETLAQVIDRYAPMFFDPEFDQMVTCKTPGEGRDILHASANNFYAGVTMADLSEAVERHPVNSRLVRRDGRLVEEVYRLGGRYDAELREVVHHLNQAASHAPPALSRALEALVRWYTTGEESDREAFDIAWVENRDTVVDTMNGFVEVYMDARGVKGSWQGVVYHVNHDKTYRIDALATHAQWFEDHLPIDPRFRKPHVQGVSARAIDVVFGAGDSGPLSPIGVNLPNDQRIREQYGSKSVTLANVMDAHDRSTPDSFREEFCWDEAEAARARQWGALAAEITTGIHEVLGHGSGRMADGVLAPPQDLLQEQYSALEETRADLVALYFIAHPQLARLEVLDGSSQDEIVRAEYEAYARTALVQLRRVREGSSLEEDHMRNRQAIVHWLMAHTTAIDRRVRDGKTFYVLADVDAFHQGVSRLLAEVQRMKSEGDYPAAKRLFESYGIHFESTLRDEVVTRVDRLKLPSYTGFVMPELEPVYDAAGELVDVDITYPCDLTTQMLRFSASRRQRARARRVVPSPSGHNGPVFV